MFSANFKALQNFTVLIFFLTLVFHCFSSEYQLLAYFVIRIILHMVFKGDKHVNAVKKIQNFKKYVASLH